MLGLRVAYVTGVAVVDVAGRSVQAVRVASPVRRVEKGAGDVADVRAGRIVRAARAVAVGVGDVRTSLRDVGSKQFRIVRMRGSLSEEGGEGQERAKGAK